MQEYKQNTFFDLQDKCFFCGKQADGKLYEGKNICIECLFESETYDKYYEEQLNKYGIRRTC